MTPNEPCQQRPREVAVERIDYCRKMLVIHGFISDGENAKVITRMQKWVRLPTTPTETKP